MEQPDVLQLGALAAVLISAIGTLALWTRSLVIQGQKDAQEREKRFAGEVATLSKFIHDTLMGVIEKSAESLAQNTEAMNRTWNALEKAEAIALQSHDATMQLIERMNQNPCLLGNRDEQTSRIADEIAKRVKDDK